MTQLFISKPFVDSNLSEIDLAKAILKGAITFFSSHSTVSVIRQISIGSSPCTAKIQRDNIKKMNIMVVVITVMENILNTEHGFSGE